VNSNHQRIRDYLKDSDGLTTRQLQFRSEIEQRTICKALKAMPDAYIDRWTGPHRGQWAAVWCVVEVPEDCPKPDEKNMEAPLLQKQRANRARQDDLGDGKGKGVADNMGVDQRQSIGGQALGFIRKTLWRKRSITNKTLDAGDQKQ
jgi:hypothetical protein